MRDTDKVLHLHNPTMVEDFPMELEEGKKQPCTSRFSFIFVVTDLEKAFIEQTHVQFLDLSATPIG